MSRGYIRQRSTGTWTITVDAGVDPVTGKRRQKVRTVRGTKAFAERERTRLLAEVDARRLNAGPGRLTVGAYLLEQWLPHMKPRLAERSFERYEGIVRAHLVPALGAFKLRDLEPLHIQRYYAAALQNGRRDGRGALSAKTVLHHHRLLSEALKQARRWRLLAVNPAEDVQPPRARRPERVIVDDELAHRILQVARATPLEIPVTLALGLGLRLGEVLGLRWEDVSLEPGRELAEIRQTAQSLRADVVAELRASPNPPQTCGIVVFKEPKTDQSRRTVDLPAFVAEALRALRKDQAERRLLLGPAWDPHGHDLIVERGDGRPWPTHDASHAFATFAARHGFPQVRFHDLRHAFATLSLAAGTDLKVVSESMGHTSIKITADLYQDVIPRLRRDAADRLDALIGPAR
jgi:integrase